MSNDWADEISAAALKLANECGIVDHDKHCPRYPSYPDHPCECGYEAKLQIEELSRRAQLRYDTFPEGPVDGGGRPLADHVRDLAEKLQLSEEQRSLLVAEVRNALVPVHLRTPSKGVIRVLALMDAIAR